MDWPRFSYSYDGSFAGFLTCVFTAYANKEEPACFLGLEEDQAALWPQRTVDTDQQKARRVYRSLDKKLGSQGKRLVTYGFLTCLPQRELCLWDFLKLGYERGPAVVRDLTDPRVAVLGKAVQHLTREAHLLKGFTRFSDQGGALAGEIAPKNRVLPLLRPHFAARYPGETPATPGRPSSSMTAPITRPSSARRASGPSSPWRSFPWAGRPRGSWTTGSCGGGFTTPYPSRAATTPNAA